MNRQVQLLQLGVNQICSRLVECDEHCRSINCNTRSGYMPRGLVLDDKDAKGRGCFVVATNPGHADDCERAFYRKHRCAPESFEAAWYHFPVRRGCHGIRDYRHYADLRKLVRDFGINGPILWSDAYKCEHNAAEAPRDLEKTRRACSRRYLSKELNILPKGWPIIAAGGVAWEALHELPPAPDRDPKLIRIPHPNARYGAFPQLLCDTNRRRMAQEFLENKEPTLDLRHA